MSHKDEFPRQLYTIGGVGNRGFHNLLFMTIQPGSSFEIRSQDSRCKPEDWLARPHSAPQKAATEKWNTHAASARIS